MTKYSIVTRTDEDEQANDGNDGDDEVDEEVGGVGDDNMDGDE